MMKRKGSFIAKLIITSAIIILGWLLPELQGRAEALQDSYSGEIRLSSTTNQRMHGSYLRLI